MKDFYKKNKTAITLTLFMFLIMLLLSSLCYLSALMQEIKALQVIFSLLIPIGYLMIVVFFSRKSAYEDMKVNKRNEIAVQNGEEIKLKDKISGFFYLKGYLAGLIICIPLVILIIIYYCLPEEGAFIVGVVAKTMYFTFWGFLYALNAEMPFVVMLYTIPIMVATMGISYHLFGLKLIYQRREIMEEKKKHEAFSQDIRNRIYKNKGKEETDESNSGEV